MIQDIRPEIFRNEYTMKRAAEPGDVVFIFNEDKVMMQVWKDGLVKFPTVGDLAGVPLEIPEEVREKKIKKAEGSAVQGADSAGGLAENLNDNGNDRDEKGRPGAGCGRDGRTLTEDPVNRQSRAGFLQYLFEINGRGFYLWMNENPAEKAPMPGELGLLVDSKERTAAEILTIDNNRSADAERGEKEEYSYEPLRTMRKAGPKELAFASETAYQLFGWYRDNRYCGRCGHVMKIGRRERNMVCPRCGNHVYPRIMPAVIVGVLRPSPDGDPSKDAILMTRYAGRAYKGHALIAGFCEIGETGEDTVRREVMEEAGIRVKNIRYYKTQPWGFDSDLLLGYYCEVDGDDTITREEDELASAAWVPRDEIEDEFEDMSLTNEMIVRFREGENSGRR